MTIDKNTTEQNPSLPEARSPKALDDRILSYARNNAAEQPRTHISAWMSGLAAASIVGIAVLITLPEQYSPKQVSSAQYIPDMELQEDSYASRSSAIATAPSLQRLEQRSEAADMEQRKNLVSADTDTQAHPPTAILAKSEKYAGAANADAESAESYREAPPALRLKESPSAPEIPARTTSYAEIEPTISTEQRTQGGKGLEELMVTTSKREYTSEQSLEEAALLDSGDATPPTDIVSGLASTEPVKALSAKKILAQQDDKLEECILLWKNEKLADAKACYAALLEDCQDCSLPDTVQEAAKAFPRIGTNDPNKPQ
jgi:hypothetical protein